MGIMYTIALATIMGMALGACSGLKDAQKFTVADLQNADKLAIANGDKTGQECWEAILPQVQATQEGPLGLATGIEVGRGAVAANIPFKCQGILPITIPGL